MRPVSRRRVKVEPGARVDRRVRKRPFPPHETEKAGQGAAVKVQESVAKPNPIRTARHVDRVAERFRRLKSAKELCNTVGKCRVDVGAALTPVRKEQLSGVREREGG